jgi:hypothetical protein
LAGWLAICLSACASQAPSGPQQVQRPSAQPVPSGPAEIVLVATPIEFQDQVEPTLTEKTFAFELPRRPRRARLKLRYSSVPGATSPDYTMGRFRHRVELNKAFLMDLNTFSNSEQEVVETTKWISPGMFRRDNQLTFIAGDDGNREARPDRDEFSLRSAVLEFDW